MSIYNLKIVLYAKIEADSFDEAKKRAFADVSVINDRKLLWWEVPYSAIREVAEDQMGP